MHHTHAPLAARALRALAALALLTSSAASAEPPPAPAAPAAPAAPSVKRGEEIPADATAVSLDAIAESPEGYINKTVVVTGTVSAVCQAKGCWMTLAGEKSTSRARVTFKDYAFFVPKDGKGRRARLTGEVKMKRLGEAERAHLAQDGRVDVSEIPSVELRFVASGVELW